MLKSVTRVVSKSSNLGQRNVYRETPKTRFNANDRSASSPRLKSFPAEKIRRIDPPPIQTSPENVNASRQIVNSGQGDASQDFQNAQLSRAIPNQSISSSSEPRVFQSPYPMENHANQSQPTIPSNNRAMESSTLERPPHRPYVAYGHHPQNAPNYPNAYGAQGMVHRSENASGHLQPQMQPQYYYQQNGVPNQMSQQFDNRIKMSSNDQTSQSLPQIPNANASANRPVGQQQMYQQRDQIPNQIVQPNNVRMENSMKNQAKRKPLKFTPRMIKDQELLVATMRQQGVKDDIMRRQFEALLTEQRKQLLYLEALENPEILIDERKSLEGRKVQRRISRIEEDGKPEWMLHITPPRIPYAVWEKMQAERQADLRMPTPIEPKPANNFPGNQIHCQSNGNCQHAAQQSHQNFGQISAPNISYQQPQYSYVPNNNNNNVSLGQHEQQTSHNYPIHHQQQAAPCMSEHRVQPETPAPTQNDDGQKVRNIAPSSLLQLRIYKEVIRRQKQNNGLQDAETIKEAMEALKNPANRKGLEYLENLNKKREKPVTLNGVQEPGEMATTNQYETYVCQEPSMKIPSANGLANARNPNNPPPREILRQKKMDQGFVTEYPVQRTRFNYREYCSPAERENGTIAMTNNNNNFNIHATHGNPQGTSNPQPGIVNDQKFSGNPTSHNHFPNPPNQQPQFHPQNHQNNHDHHGKHCNHFHPVNHQDRMPPKPAYFTNEMAHQQFYDPRRHSDLCEPIIIGGVNYLARKPMYTQNAPSQYYVTNHGRNFNPTIPCQ